MNFTNARYLTILQSTIVFDPQNVITVMILFFVQHFLTSFYIQDYFFHHYFGKHWNLQSNSKHEKLRSQQRALLLCATQLQD